MRRFLVVGCGGSGGATLAYMMDELRSEVSRYGLGLPAGWQFVHLDVPVAPEGGPDGIGNVPDQGGIYVGCGTTGSSYAPLDATVTSRPRILDEIATWAPSDPSRVPVPINVGAGQFRAIGRMITLSRAVDLRQKLGAAWANLMRIETIQELADLERAVVGESRSDRQRSAPPVVLVVSSMAGGSGASMALDVCRLLTEIPVTSSPGVFMYSADVFDSLAPDARTGVRGNSLAMAGEIIAAQSGASRPHDQAVLRALGLNAGEGVTPPFARVFPVSRQVGLEKTPYGDGSQKTVYRGLARGLAGLIMSEQASEEFVAYDLGNTGQPPASKDAFGWGLEGLTWDPMPWGAFGYASLSTGRERFGEYAAQRIARSAVDRLMRGHLAPGSTASSGEQLKALMDSQWDATCRTIGMPLSAQDFLHWVAMSVFGDSENEAQRIVQSDVIPYVSPPAGQNGPGFLTTIRGQLNGQRGRLTAAAEGAAYLRAYSWHQDFAAAIVRVVGAAVSRHGLPYGIALVERIETHLRELVVPQASAGTRLGPKDVAGVPQDSEAAIGAIRGVIANGHQLMSTLIDGMRHPVRSLLLATGCGLIAQAAPALVAEVLSPLRTSMNDALAYLEMVTSSPVTDIGLAHLQTDHYAAWPSDSDQQISARFMHALNEVLLIKSSEFDEEFRRQLVASVQRDRPVGASPSDPGLLNQVALYETTRQIVIEQVIAGDWPTTGGVMPPRDLLAQSMPWRTRVFGRDPHTGQTSVPQSARFELRARPADVLARARRYVKRPNESFDNFVKISLRELVDASTSSDAERAAQHTELRSAFTEALGRARPMMSVNTEAVNRIHSNGAARYRFKFSEVPFADLPIADELAARLGGNSDIDDESLAIFRRALAGVDSLVSRIDIFGSYANLSPVVFDAVLTPASDEWAATPAEGRLDYWRWRRTRPLTASLPMSDVERRAMIAGWFVGQVTGEIRFPAPPFNDHTGPAEVWDASAGRWVPFPNPMLTPPKRFKAEYDWLPAVLESSLIAFAAAAVPPILTSMRPYQLLRGLFDDSKESPTELGPLTQTSAERRLIDWLLTGKSPSGQPSSVPGAADVTLPQERADAVLAWLKAVNSFAGREYCAPGDAQAPGGGMYSQIGDRKTASRTPMFRDIGPDVFTVTTDLRGLVNQALMRALTGPAVGTASSEDEVDDPGLQPPSAGVSF